MKIAITSEGETLESAVDPRFGRGAYFLLVDSESEEFRVVNNEQNLAAAQGAGIQAAETVARSGAKALLTGHCGPNAFRTLQAAGIAVYTGASGTAREALERFRSGTWEASSGADVEGHW